MNQHVTEIWDRAAKERIEGSTEWETQKNFLDKFAELIVLDCCDLVNSLYQFDSKEDCPGVRYIKHRYEIK